MSPSLVEYLAEVDETSLVPWDLRHDLVQLLEDLLEREIGPLGMLELPATGLAVGAREHPAEGRRGHGGENDGQDRYHSTQHTLAKKKLKVPDEDDCENDLCFVNICGVGQLIKHLTRFLKIFRSSKKPLRTFGYANKVP